MPAPRRRRSRSPRQRLPLDGRVLLVEDEPIVSGYMQDLLRSWGLEVVLEPDPLAAARRLADPEHTFALLLTDQTMPGMTGLALARHATRERPGLPVVLYTGNASDIVTQELAASGVTALLRKPIDATALRRLLARTAGAARGRRSLSHGRRQPVEASRPLHARGLRGTACMAAAEFRA